MASNTNPTDDAADKPEQSGSVPPGTASTQGQQGSGTAGTGSNPPAKPGDGQEQSDQSSGKKDESSTYTSRAVNNIIKKKREEWEREAATQAESARVEAERTAAEKAGQFQTLYEQEKSRAATLAQRVKELETRLGTWTERESSRLDTRIKEWPQEVLDTDPGVLYPDSATLEQRAAWADKMEPLVARITGTVRNPGNLPSPNAAGTGATPETQAAYEMEVRRRNPVSF